MSGGQLVVVDRSGRDVKRYPLPSGLATLGSDPACDVRVMLPAVSAHHATVAVHANQTVVRSVSERETLVNGVSVSVAALRHGDVLELGGRRLRWEYADAAARRPLAPQPALQRRAGRARGRRRASEPPPRDVLVPCLRASMPASSSSSTSGKQVAIVQPQRRDTSDQNEASARAAGMKQRAYAQARKRSAPPAAGSDSAAAAEGAAEGAADAGGGERERALAAPTQASLWIESRKPPARRPASAKKATPLRMAVLKRVQSAQKMRVMKIQAPLKLDSTKQAAIMLMTGYTPKSKQTSPKQGKRPSYVVKKPSPVKTPKQGSAKRSSGRQSTITPKSSSNTQIRMSSRSSKAFDDKTGSILEITDSDAQDSNGGSSSSSRRSGAKSPLRSPLLPSPKKSALKDPSAKKSGRKNESIKFDLSNLENNTYNRSSDVLMVTETTSNHSNSDESLTDMTLHYSDTSSTRSPSPRKSINSRSSRILEKSTGSPMTESPTSDRSTLIESPQPRKSLRGSIILQKVLRSSEAEVSSYSRRTTKSVSDQSWSTTIASARQTRTLSPRASQNKVESYSIVDLVSIDSNESGQSGSVYNSAGSAASSAAYDTPETVTGRRTRSTIDPSLVGSSTPYVLLESLALESKAQKSTRASRSSLTIPQLSTQAALDSETITTPENTEDAIKSITFNSTRISRASKSRSRINDSDVLLIEGEEEESSPKSSRRISKTGQPSPMVRKNISINVTPSNSPSVNEGMSTPENRHSPEDASTPVLNIQSLLDASQLSDKSQSSQKRVRRSVTIKRKTIGAMRSDPRRGRVGLKSKSLNLSTARSLRGRDISINLNRIDGSQTDEEVVTPKSAVKLVQEAVKNKHSTAKKPQSKRSLIDNLNESDIVKQLFNSPVKRKLSQSMTEFSRKNLFEDDDLPARPTRATIAVAGQTPDNSVLENTEAYTPDVFVSPLNTPTNSPNLTGIKRLFQKNTPENDIRNVKGVKGLLRTPRTRKSIKNDLSNVGGVKNIFAKSPRNRLSDVRIKRMFAKSPRNDLRRVSGVKTLFRSQRKAKSPRNELGDVRGVRTLFQKNSPKNDLRNVSGVKKMLQRKSPRNDLSDVSGVKQMFNQNTPRDELSDMSGVELFQDNIDSTFDQLMGRPPIRSYAKSKSLLSKVEKKKTRKTKSLHDSIGPITNNVEEWLENELRKRVHKGDGTEPSTSTARKSSPNKLMASSKGNRTRELQKLTTDTIGGNVPIVTSRTRNSSMIKNVQSDESTRKKSASELYSAHTLPIKKRSLVETSINKSTNDRSNKLPIKKRVVVHSTPVKGKVNMTMNASEIGRMSPIVSEDTTKATEIEVMIRPPPQPKKSPKTKPARAGKAQPEQIEKVVENVQSSPKKTRAAKAVQSSPAATRAIRGGRKNKNDNQEIVNVKKRRSSLVITKKPPVLSPKPTSPRATRRGKSIVSKEVQALQEASIPSPKRTRAKAQTSVEFKTTPKKNTRTKARRSSMIVTKPSPKLKPRATRQTKEKTTSQQPLQIETKRKRKTTLTDTEPKQTNKNNKSEIPKETKAGAAKKTRKNNVETEPKGKGKADAEIVDQPRRTRKTAAQDKTSDKVVQNKKTRKATESNAEEIEPKTRGRKVKIDVQETTVQPKRGRNTKAESAVAETVVKGKGRKTKVVEATETTEPKGRGRKADSVQDETVGRTRRAKATDQVVEPTRGRKRKNTEQDDTEATNVKIVQEAKTRGAKGNARQTRNTTVATDEVKGNSRKRKGANNSQEKSVTVATGRKTRNTAQEEPESKPVRGKKATAVAENATQGGGRKKRTNADLSDAKENKKEPAKKPKAAATPSPAPRESRSRASAAVTQRGRRR